MTLTAYELHDGSAPPTREEAIFDAVLELIQSDDDSHITEALGGEALLNSSGHLALSIRLRLVAAICGKGTASQAAEDRKLGELIRKKLFDYLERGLDE